MMTKSSDHLYIQFDNVMAKSLINHIASHIRVMISRIKSEARQLVKSPCGCGCAPGYAAAAALSGLAVVTVMGTAVWRPVPASSGPGVPTSGMR